MRAKNKSGLKGWTGIKEKWLSRGTLSLKEGGRERRTDDDKRGGDEGARMIKFH